MTSRAKPQCVQAGRRVQRRLPPTDLSSGWPGSTNSPCQRLRKGGLAVPKGTAVDRPGQDQPLSDSSIWHGSPPPRGQASGDWDDMTYPFWIIAICLAVATAIMLAGAR